MSDDDLFASGGWVAGLDPMPEPEFDRCFPFPFPPRPVPIEGVVITINRAPLAPDRITELLDQPRTLTHQPPRRSS